jgi:hypothetical protein
MFVSCKTETNETTSIKTKTDQTIQKHTIEKIEFESRTDIRGETQIILNANLTGTFKNITGYYEKAIGRSAQLKISKEQFDKVADLLNRINFTSLKDDYTTNHTCAAIADLKITYDNGKIKKIHDLGMDENHNLIKLYGKIRNVSDSILQATAIRQETLTFQQADYFFTNSIIRN